jgi:hypothetical protein
VKTVIKVWIAGLALFSMLVGPGGAQAGRSIGAGLNYWHTLKNIDLSEFDRDGASWFVTYQSSGKYFIGWEADLELMPEGFMASPKKVYAPQVYAVVKMVVTGAVGIGWYYSDGDWADEPFYVLRAGMEFPLLPKITLDIDANYRFTKWGELKDQDDKIKVIDTDTIMLGAALRLHM